MKKLFLLLVLITTGVSAQEKFTVGGGGGIVAFDGNDGFNFNLFANYDIGRKTAIGVDTWMTDVESINLLATHLVVELRDAFEFSLGNANFGTGAYIGPGFIQAKLDEIDENKDYFSFLIGINVDYILSNNWRTGIRYGNHITSSDLGTVFTANLFVSYSF